MANEKVVASFCRSLDVPPGHWMVSARLRKTIWLMRIVRIERRMEVVREEEAALRQWHNLSVVVVVVVVVHVVVESEPIDYSPEFVALT